jgi:small GTP-binding protein
VSTNNPSYFKKEEINKNGEKVIINIWDTAGQEIFNSLNTIYYKDAVAALLVYDVSKFNDTFPKVEKWAREIIEVNSNDVFFVICGNKYDLLNSKDVINQNNQVINQFCNKYKCKNFFTSAKSGSNVDQAFKVLIDYMKDNCKSKKQISKGLKIDKNQLIENNNKKKGCC